MEIEAILTPAEIATLPRRDLRAATCVVFDVLRATSTMLTALSNGARRIYPVCTVEEARHLKSERLPGALLGGERGGRRLDGFDLGNSPREYTASAVAGRDIITTTTNGTVALRACAGAGEVMAGAWLNLDALAGWLAADRVVLVCAGTGEGFALEDGLAAGALVSRLRERAHRLDDAARTVLALFEHMGGDPLTAFQTSANGRRLAEIGLGADLADCAAPSALPWIARMRGDAMEGEVVATARQTLPSHPRRS